MRAIVGMSVLVAGGRSWIDEGAARTNGNEVTVDGGLGTGVTIEAVRQVGSDT